jgi:hypothetical protein
VCAIRCRCTGVLPELLHPRDDVVSKRLSWLHDLDDVWQLAIARAPGNPIVRKQVEQSFLDNPIPKQALMMLKERNFVTAPEDLRDAIFSLFSLGQTALNEEANRAARHAETHENDNCRMRSLRCWLLPYRREVLGKDGKGYNSVKHTDWNAEIGKHAKTAGITQAMFDPGSREAALPLKSVVGNEHPDFVTTTPNNAARCYAHVAYWCHCARDPTAWHLSGRLWLCQLFTRGMLIHDKLRNETCISLLTVDRCATLAWKVDMVVFHGKDLFVPVTDPHRSPYLWLTCTDIAQFEARRISWVGNAWRVTVAQAAGAKGDDAIKLSSGQATGLFASPIDPWAGLMAASARTAFKEMNLAGLMDIVEQFAVVIIGEREEYQVTLQLVRHFLPGLTDEEYISILAQREQRHDPMESLLESQEALDAYGQDDLCFLEKWKETRKKEGKDTYKNHLDDFRLRAFKATKSTKYKPDATHRGTIKEGTRVYPDIAADNTLSLEQARLFVPPGCTVLRSELDSRWRLSMGVFNISRSWPLHGSLGAFSKCANFMWTKFSVVRDFECPFPWILESDWRAL